jgi:hypothetical protein
MVNLTDAPGPRFRHSAVWTGRKMVIRGGGNSGNFLNTGGRFDPAANSWTPSGTTVAEVPDEELLAVHEALDKFEANNPEEAELVKLRYFVGLTIEEAACVLSVSAPTAKRYWAYARAGSLVKSAGERRSKAERRVLAS